MDHYGDNEPPLTLLDRLCDPIADFLVWILNPIFCCMDKYCCDSDESSEDWDYYSYNSS